MALTFTDTGVNTSYLRNDSFSGVITAYPYTLACWGRATNVTQQNDAIWVGDSTAATNFSVLQFAGGTTGDPIRAVAFSTVAANSLSATGFTANTWYHAGAVFSSTTSRLAYIDGVAGTANTNTRALPTINSYSIGFRGDSTPANEFDGRICEVGIWTAALTAADMASLATGVPPSEVRPDALVVYCPLIRNYQERAGGFTPTAGATTPTVSRHTRVFYPAPQGAFHGSSAINRTLTADTGSFLTTGQAATLQHDKVIIAETGAGLTTGQPVTLRHNLVLTAETGAFDINGQAAELIKDAVLIADTGSFSTNGQGANLFYGLTLTAETGAFTTTGQDAGLRKDYTINAETGEFLTTGQDAVLTKGNVGVLVANTGAFFTTGQDANLIYSGAGADGGASLVLWRRRGKR